MMLHAEDSAFLPWKSWVNTLNSRLLSIALDCSRLLSIALGFLCYPRYFLRSSSYFSRSSSYFSRSFKTNALDCSRLLSITLDYPRLLSIALDDSWYYGLHTYSSNNAKRASFLRSGTSKSTYLGTCRGCTFWGPKSKQFRGPQKEGSWTDRV